MATDPLLAQTLGRKYRLLELIGSGAMGKVYRAEHVRLRRQVAIKVIHPELGTDVLSVRRFEQEARAASRLRHPHVVQVYDFGTTDASSGGEGGLLYLEMELLQGCSLGDLARRQRTLGPGAAAGQLDPLRAARLLCPALQALEAAHGAGIIHRDFKPENIFIEDAPEGGAQLGARRSESERVKVLDFGIAKLLRGGDSRLTLSGSVCGTPDYMAPEQIRGEELDPRSDVYAAGVVLYELLCGVRPFDGSLLEVLTRHLSEPPVPPRARGAQVPESIERVCLRALQKRREDRFRSAAEMEQALQAALAQEEGRQCPSCREITPARVRFCPWCGASLYGSPARSVLAKPTQVQAPEQPAPAWPVGLLGREELLADLRLHLQPGQAVLLWGAEGVGKTALAHALGKAQVLHRSRGRRAIWVTPDPSGAQSPLHPIRCALAEALDLPELRPEQGDRLWQAGQLDVERIEQQLRRAQLDQEGPFATADLAGLSTLFGVPEQALRAPRVARRYDQRQRDCFTAALRVLRQLPLLYVFEDMDRYDGPSQQLLRMLCHNPGRSAVLLTAVAPLGGAGFKELGPLCDQRQELLPLSAELLQAGGVVAAAARAGQGHPGVTRDAQEALSEAGVCLSARARLAALPRPAWALLEALAVLGVEADLARCGALAALDPVEARAAAAELLRRGHLVQSGERLRLPSAARRDFIYYSVPRQRRRALHRRVYEQLRGAAGAGTDERAQVGHHALLGNPAQAPLAPLLLAGDAARGAFDDGAAERWYRLAYGALHRLARRGQAPKDLLVQAGLSLALVLRCAGKIIDAEQTLRETLRVGIRDLHAEANAHRGLAKLAAAWEMGTAVREELTAAIMAGWRAGDPQLLVELYLELGAELVQAGDMRGAERELREGLHAVTRGEGLGAVEGPRGLWQLLLRLGEVVLQQGRVRDALGFGQHGLRFAEKHGDAAARSRAQRFLGEVYQVMGDEKAAARFQRLALAEAREAGDRRGAAELLIALSMLSSHRTPQEEDGVRALLEEASRLSWQIDWHEGVELAERQMEGLRTVRSLPP